MARDKKLQKKKISRKSNESPKGKRSQMGQSTRDSSDRTASKDRNPRKQSASNAYPSPTLHQWGTSAAGSIGGYHLG